MTKNIKLFLIVILVSLPFWWGMNVLQENIEDFFYTIEIEKNPSSLFIAQIAQSYTAKSPEIRAESVRSVKIDKTGAERVLFSRTENQKMPIASLTKLMTAVIASEFYQPSDKIRISKQAVGQLEAYGNLKVGEILQVQDLLAIMLIESSNDAAFALAEKIGLGAFVNLMNFQAKYIMKLESTYFFNPTGLDPEDLKEPANQINHSTTQDLVKLAKYLLEKHPEILEIFTKKEEVYSENGIYHELKNTNELLGEISGIIAGKTGYTGRAGGCLILILKGKKPETYFINVILNSPDKFEDMRELIKAYGPFGN